MNPATLDRDGIAARIPHSGSMCLLDSLLHWTPDEALCRASSHRDATNPLRSPGGLLSPVAIEYASQAMALHGAITAGAPQGAGFLAALSGLEVGAHVAHLVAGGRGSDTARSAPASAAKADPRLGGLRAAADGARSRPPSTLSATAPPTRRDP